MNAYNYDQNFSRHCLDTKILCKWLEYKGSLTAPKLSLQSLRQQLNLDLDLPAECVPHSALGDCLTVIALLSHLI